MPLLAGETDEHRDVVFCEGGRLHGETHCMELKSGLHGDPSGLHWPRLDWQRAEGFERSEAVVCRIKERKYARRMHEADELYVLKNDPGSLRNRIHDPALACCRARRSVCSPIPWRRARSSRMTPIGGGEVWANHTHS